MGAEGAEGAVDSNPRLVPPPAPRLGVKPAKFQPASVLAKRRLRVRSRERLHEEKLQEVLDAHLRLVRQAVVLARGGAGSDGVTACMVSMTCSACWGAIPMHCAASETETTSLVGSCREGCAHWRSLRWMGARAATDSARGRRNDAGRMPKSKGSRRSAIIGPGEWTGGGQGELDGVGGRDGAKSSTVETFRGAQTRRAVPRSGGAARTCAVDGHDASVSPGETGRNLARERKRLRLSDAHAGSAHARSIDGARRDRDG